MKSEKELCEVCGNASASLVIVRGCRGEFDRTFVCPDCAAEQSRLYMRSGLNIERILTCMDRKTAGESAVYSCRLCGGTLADIIVDGKPGCCMCYVKFAGELERSIAETQHCSRSVGKSPKSGSGHVGASGVGSAESGFGTQYAGDLPAWVLGNGQDADIVISTRARLARSLASIPFPSRASGEDLNMVVQKVRRACAHVTSKYPGLKALDMEKLSREEKSYLLDAHLASVEQILSGKGRSLILEPSAIMSIMVNEEDHLRVQALVSGLACQETWERVDEVDDLLSKELEFGYCQEYGYLTASVSNVGTGLRISAMMHLAGLAAKKRLNAQLRAAYDLGVSVRGMFGEGSYSVGDLFQVSNEVTLGISEREIAERVRAVAQFILEEERQARRELLDADRNQIVENASHALSVLQDADSIAAKEAIRLMSPIRLAAALELVENCPRSLLNELLIGMRVGSGEDYDAGVGRAVLLRSRLAGVRMMHD